MTPPADGKIAKGTLRAAALARRDAIPEAECVRMSEAICERAIAVLENARPTAVAAYRAIRSEVDPAAIVAWALRNDVVAALPTVAAGVLIFRRYEAGTILIDAGFGTLAPGPEAPIVDPAGVIVPLAGFDRAGHRLGYGRGYYDRGIADLRARGIRPLTLGVAFAAQEVDAIQTEPHDVRLDVVVTESETIDLRNS